MSRISAISPRMPPATATFSSTQHDRDEDQQTDYRSDHLISFPSRGPTTAAVRAMSGAADPIRAGMLPGNMADLGRVAAAKETIDA